MTGRLRSGGRDRLLVIVHGLGGHAQSGYAVRAAAAAEAAGWDCLRLYMRGADRHGHDFYHAGLTADLHAALKADRLADYRHIAILGYSMGGHVTLRFAAEPHDPRVIAAMTVCAPVDLNASAYGLDHQVAAFYRNYVLDGLREGYYAYVRRHGQPVGVDCTPAQAERIRTIREWDQRIVVPRFGYESPDHYWEAESAIHRLHDARCDTLFVHADHDPMVLSHTVLPALAGAQRKQAREGRQTLQVARIGRGGHVGFPPGASLPDHVFDHPNRNTASRTHHPKQHLEHDLLAWLNAHPALNVATQAQA